MKKTLIPLVSALLIALILAGCDSCADKIPVPSSSSEVRQTTTASTPPKTSGAVPVPSSFMQNWEYEGTYLVGTDIPADEYVVENITYQAYVEVASDKTGSLDSVIANKNINTHIYITVRKGQYFKVQGAKFRSSTANDAYKMEEGLFEEGMYKVGKDIQPGDYAIKGDEEAMLSYFEVSSDSTQLFSSIIHNGTLEPGAETVITVEDGQFLMVENGTIAKAKDSPVSKP